MSLAILGIIFYTISASGLLLIFTNKTKVNALNISLVGCLGLALHTIYVFQHFQLDVYETFSLLIVTNLITIFVSVIAILFALLSKNYFTLPVNFLFSGFVLLASQFIPNADANFSGWSGELIGHIFLSVASYAILLISTLLSFQYNLVSSRLKHHDLSILSLPMPSLTTIENQVIMLLKLGSSVLLLSIVTGFIFLDNFLGSGQAHKALLSSLACICFFAALFGHQTLGWRGKYVLLLNFTGSLFLTMGYFGSRFVKEFILS
ncbi:inner membrane protein YpjD [Catenovulum maritimum]|uniref:cytochrome C assembly family protein n=1 Tax=Catenovulum maritimum TaxID=1513271 RepID=UPI00066129CF|nr:cytochrome c biogenesis protein CcsA [Catenovulum maritimum]